MRSPSIVLLLISAILMIREAQAMDMKMMMPMWFWKGNNLTWLLHDLESTNSTDYFGGLMTVFLIAIGLQILEFCRNYIYIKAQMRAIQHTEALNL